MELCEAWDFTTTKLFPQFDNFTTKLHPSSPPQFSRTHHANSTWRLVPSMISDSFTVTHHKFTIMGFFPSEFPILLHARLSMATQPQGATTQRIPLIGHKISWLQRRHRKNAGRWIRDVSKRDRPRVESGGGCGLLFMFHTASHQIMVGFLFSYAQHFSQRLQRGLAYREGVLLFYGKGKCGLCIMYDVRHGKQLVCLLENKI